jgi:hypothetical protein
MSRLRLGPGLIGLSSLRKVLAAADRPMRGADIHRAVEGLLGHPVPENSVGWCLATGTRAKVPRFERVAYGY